MVRVGKASGGRGLILYFNSLILFSGNLDNISTVFLRKRIVYRIFTNEGVIRAIITIIIVRANNQQVIA